MIFQHIEHGSVEYHAACELRNQVLRIPLGMSLYSEDLCKEKNQQHFGLFDADRELLACVIVVAISPTEAKIRQMAVRDDRQGQGLGRSIISHVETYMRDKGFAHSSMHARCSAIGFYEKLGYNMVGGEFTEVGLPHVCMEKFL